MTERERLIDMLAHVDDMRIMRCGFGECADYMLANGVIVPPCKVGGIVYEVQELYKRVQEYEVVSLLYSNSGFSFGWNLKDGKGFYSNNVLGFTDCDIGKTVFLTREDAEKALEGET